MNLTFLHISINLLNRFIKQTKQKGQDKKVKYLISSVFLSFYASLVTLTLSLFRLYCSAPLCCPLANSFIRTPLLTALISDPSIPWPATSKERERRGEGVQFFFFNECCSSLGSVLVWKDCVDLLRDLIAQWSLLS